MTALYLMPDAQAPAADPATTTEGSTGSIVSPPATTLSDLISAAAAQRRRAMGRVAEQAQQSLQARSAHD